MRSSIVLISDSNFTTVGSSSISYGGGVYLQDSEVNFENTTFEGNRATSGGAIAHLCSSISKCSLKISNSILKGNSVSLKGGAIYYNFRPPQIGNGNTFSNNSASYGNNLGSFPVRIGKIGSKNGEPMRIKDATSGLRIKTPIELAIFDFDNQVMELDSSSQINIFPISKNTSIKGINTAIVKKGSALFNNLVVVSEPGSNRNELEISSNIIDKAKVALAFDNQIVHPKLIIDFNYCKPGEQVIGIQ